MLRFGAMTRRSASAASCLVAAMSMFWLFGCDDAATPNGIADGGSGVGDGGLGATGGGAPGSGGQLAELVEVFFRLMLEPVP